LSRRWSKKLRKATRPARHWLLWQTVRAIESLMGALPPRAAIQWGARLGRLGLLVDRRDGRLAQRHLEQAFGAAMSEAQRRRVTRGIFENLGRCGAELCVVRRRGPAFLKDRYTFSGEENILRFVRAGRGAVVVTAHLDNWEMAGHCVTQLLGLRTLVVAQRQSDAMIEQWINDTRRRMGMTVHIRGEDARFLLQRLREGDVLFTLLDQDTGESGAFVPFFGRPAFTLTGPAILAVRTGVPLLTAFSRRNPDGLTHHIHFNEPLEDSVPRDGVAPRGEERDRRAVELTRRATEQIEAAIRQAPDQWVWFHERWKRQPS